MIKNLLLGLTFIFSSFITFAQVPANDLCENAAVIVCGDLVMGSTTEATEIGEITAFCGTGEAAPGVWYSFAGTGDNITVSLCASTYDTKLQIFSGNCNGPACIDGTDDDCGAQSEITFTSDASTNYLFYVFGFNTAVGDYTIEVTCAPPPPPTENDLCEDAIPISCGDVVTGFTDNSTNATSPEDGCGTPNGAPGNWYSFMGNGDIIDLSLCGGSNYDTKIRVYSGNCFSLACVGGNDDSCGLQSEFTFVSDASTNYLIYVFGFGSSTGDYELTITCTTPPPPPINDECDQAIDAVVNPDEFCNLITQGTLAGATGSNVATACPGVANDDVWFEFVALSEIQIIELQNIMGAPDDLVHGVYEGTCDALVEIACSDGDQSTVQGLIVGQTYFIRVYTAANGITNDVTFDLCIREGLVDIVCADGNFNSSYCYDNDSTFQNFFQGDTAFPLRLVINSGIVEDPDDVLIVLDSDGITNLNAASPNGNNGDLTGLVFTASGNSISFLIQSDQSVSCADGNIDEPIDYTVICLECTEPEATYTVIGDCDDPAEFTVDVNVSDIGSGNGLTITDDQGSAPQNIAAAGIVTFGPYTANDTVVTFSLDPGDPNCVITSEAFTFACLIECYDILIVSEDMEIDCEQNCVDLEASFVSGSLPGLSTTSYEINGPICDVPPIDGGTPTNIIDDDEWSGVINIPFTFNYFGTDYSSLVIGPNGQISFDLTLAGGFNGWNSGPGDQLPVTNGNFPLNTIYGAYHDMDPNEIPDPAQINYFISGEPGSRLFVLNFNEVEHFGGACNPGFTTTQQIILFEGLNIIDVNLINKPSCPGWNDGLATLGLMGNDLTEFSVPDGRNTGAWEATNETWRFIPNGPVDPAISTTFEWQDEDGTVLGTDLMITVCPETSSATYSAVLTTIDADGVEAVYSEDVVITRTTTCGDFDCTDAQFFEGFGQGTSPVDHAFLPAPFVFDGSGQLDEAEYSVQNGLSPINNGWHVGLEDHTEDDTDGNALIINASNSPAGSEFYRREITVVPNTDYFFVVWATTMYDTDSNICPGTGDPTNFDYRFETSGGATLASSNTGDIENQSDVDWQRFVLEFNSGTNTTLELVLENVVFGACGNDYAIDDIGLYFEGTPPDIEMPDDIIGCDDDEDGFAIYDLTTQNDMILNGLSPADFTITFYTTEDDAMNGENAIADPTMYTNMVDPETIWVRVERLNQPNCFSITQFNIEIGLNIDLGINLPALFEICSNEDFPAIDGTPTNPDVDLTGVTYEWQDAAGTVVSTDAIFVPTAAGVYTLEVFAPVCGTNVYTTEVTVFDAPILDLGMDESFCEGDDPFEIVPNISGDTTGITYLWSTGETTPTITVDTTGLYTLTIMVDVCTVESSIGIEYLANPIVTLGADFQTCPDMDTTIFATVDVDGDLAYEWLDQDGNIIPNETGSSIIVQVPAGTIGATAYTVNVLNGTCIGTDTIDISLYDVDNCIISEGISPNGDGMNDTLDLQFLDDRSGIELFQIFNRHGRAIYEQLDYVNQWGGQTNEGDELPTGTYFYVIMLENDDPAYGREVSGWVYLNRED